LEVPSSAYSLAKQSYTAMQFWYFRVLPGRAKHWSDVVAK